MTGNNCNPALGGQEKNPCPRTYNLEGSTLSLFWICFLLGEKESTGPRGIFPGVHFLLLYLLWVPQTLDIMAKSPQVHFWDQHSLLHWVHLLMCPLWAQRALIQSAPEVLGFTYQGSTYPHMRLHVRLDRDRGERERERRQIWGGSPFCYALGRKSEQFKSEPRLSDI